MQKQIDKTMHIDDVISELLGIESIREALGDMNPTDPKGLAVLAAMTVPLSSLTIQAGIWKVSQDNWAVKAYTLQEAILRAAHYAMKEDYID